METWVIQINSRECRHRYQSDQYKEENQCDLYDCECKQENCKLKVK